MDGDHNNSEKIVTDFVLKEGEYSLTGGRLDLRVRSPSGQYGQGHAINAPHQTHAGGGYGAGGPNMSMPVNSANANGALESLKFCSQSYYLDGELCEMLGINYGMATYWYAYRGANRCVELDLHKMDRRFYRGAPPTSHDLCDVYQVDSHSTGSEVYHLNLVGFTQGQAQLTDYRGGQNNGKLFNEEKAYEQSKVTCIKWLPNSESEFVVGHLSGAIYHYSATEPNHQGVPVFVPIAQKDTYVVYQSRAAQSTKASSNSQNQAATATQNTTSTPKNPLHKWLVGHGSVNELQFAPHSVNRLNNSAATLLLAIATGDGFVRIFDFHQRELMGKVKSYFGAILCLAWSGDGMLLAAGGEDDLIHIYSMPENRVILRCQGHRSWISGLAFDNHFVQSRAHESMLLSRTLSQSHPSRNSRLRSYRLGSVSHDTHFCLWDIDESVLVATRKSRNRSTGTSVSRYSENVSPRTSESQHSKGSAVSSLSSGTHSQHSDATLSSATDNTSLQTQTSQQSSLSTVSSNSSSGHKKEKTGLSMFKSHSSSSNTTSNGGGGSTKSNSKMLHHINRQKVKVEEEAINVFGTPVCPRNGTIVTIEPTVYAKASYERLTAIAFMANCFVVGGKEGFVLVYSRPNTIHSPLGSPRHSESGDYLSSVPESSSHYQLSLPPTQHQSTKHHSTRTYQQHHHQQTHHQSHHHYQSQHHQSQSSAHHYTSGGGGSAKYQQQMSCPTPRGHLGSSGDVHPTGAPIGNVRIPSSSSGHQLSAIGAQTAKLQGRGE
ncbi:WD repeat-containing protein 20-like isoform X2 [Convolutriloba macropyga]|uniref:WD repeat-containing protein 20-like isoform X2 n=1 Tax=Convolutriloba macropyga TaxID=536237 RepID=UPI003F528995